MRRRRYWVLGLGWILIGGVIPAAHALDGSVLSAWACINLGLTAPLVIHTAMRALPAGKPGTVDSQGSRGAAVQKATAKGRAGSKAKVRN